MELKELRLASDRWVLVMEELVRVDANYYRPRQIAVHGSKEILDTVARLGNQDLVGAAERAMSGSHTHYRIRSGGLEQVHRKHDDRVRATKRASEPAENMKLNEKVAHLEQRVLELEGVLKRLARSTRAAPNASDSSRPSRPSSAGDARTDEAKSTNEARRNNDAQDGEDPASAPSQGVASSAPAQVSEPPDDMDSGGHDVDPQTSDRPSTPSAEPRLRFPDAEAYSKELAALLGEECPLTVESTAPDVQTGVYYASELLNDDGSVVGAIVVDLVALIHQAGTLLMLGESARDAMVAEAAPSDDVVEAMHEIVNTQSRCFNSVKGNPHVRAGDLRVVTPDDTWLSGSVHRSSLLDGFGGRTLLVSV